MVRLIISSGEGGGECGEGDGKGGEACDEGGECGGKGGGECGEGGDPTITFSTTTSLTCAKHLVMV